MCVDTLLLHRARVQRGINLADVAARTSLNPAIVQSIDAGRFDALPAGLYARSYVRAFASAVGLQPEQAVRALEPSLPRADDPLPVLREIARGAAPDWPDRIAQAGQDAADKVTALAAHALAFMAQRRRDLVGRFAALARWRSVADVASVALLSGAQRPVLPSVTQLRGCRPAWRVPVGRCAAASLDAAVLLLLLAVVVQLTAWTSGAAGGEVLTVAGAQIAALWGVLVLMYFVILGGVGGRTAGAVLCGVPPSEAHEPLRLRAILERAILH